MENKISTRNELIITSGLLMVMACGVWTIVPYFYRAYVLYSRIAKCAGASLAFYAILQLFVLITLNDKNKTYEVLKTHGDEVVYEVRRRDMYKVHILGFAGVACMTGILLAIIHVEIPVFSTATFCMFVILLIIFVFCFSLERKYMNTTVAVGKKYISVCDTKEDSRIFYIDDLQSINKYFYRKSTNTRYDFYFPNGEFSVYEEDGYYAKCLILKLKSILEQKNKNVHCEKGFKETFYNKGKEYRVERDSGFEIQEVDKNALNWVYDVGFAKQVKKEAYFAIIGIFVLELIILGVIYGIIYVWCNNIIPIILWLVAFVGIYLWLAGTHIVRCFFKTYYLIGKVIKKCAVVRKYHLSVADYYLDIDIGEGKGILRVSCTEPVYQHIIVGNTYVRLIKTKFTPLEIYYDTEDIEKING